MYKERYIERQQLGSANHFINLNMTTYTRWLINWVLVKRSFDLNAKPQIEKQAAKKYILINYLHAKHDNDDNSNTKKKKKKTAQDTHPTELSPEEKIEAVNNSHRFIYKHI